MGIMPNNMNELIITFLANSLFIWGIYVCFKEGMIFDKIGNWFFSESIYVDKKGDVKETIFSKFLEWIRKPLIGCPACMGFWYGIPGSILVCDNLFQCFVYCICMIGFNWLISDIKSYFNGSD